MSRGRALAALADGFHGRLPAEPDWMELLETANKALVTPSLYHALLSGGVSTKALPEDVVEFLSMIDARNAERNLRLKSVALGAVHALNGAAITPVYLKGVALWATCAPLAETYPRMMSDVDILVRPEEGDAAIEALLAAGFTLFKKYPAHSPHIVAEFWREGDVGMLDLHSRPPGPPALAERFDREADTLPAAWPGKARIPTPAHQIYLTALHDMFHDGGFWRGGFDVRHLCDFADLARGPMDVDWEVLKALLPTRVLRNGVFSQLVAAHDIAAAEIPPGILALRAPRLHYQRHRAQYSHPAFGFPLALSGLLLEAFNLPQHWPHFGRGGHAIEGSSAGVRLAHRLSRLQIRSHPNKL